MAGEAGFLGVGVGVVDGCKDGFGGVEEGDPGAFAPDGAVCGPGVFFSEGAGGEGAEVAGDAVGGTWWARGGARRTSSTANGKFVIG